MILIEQVVSLREWCVLRRYMSRKPAMTWDHDALYVFGRKGDLLIRRHALQRHWAEQYAGTQSDEQERIRKLIDDIDEQLIAYGLQLKKVTALTERMIENLYHGSDDESVMVIKNIMRDLRRL